VNAGSGGLADEHSDVDDLALVLGGLAAAAATGGLIFRRRSLG
jgi:LPXTG-motif cell wall-anchored protein